MLPLKLILMVMAGLPEADDADHDADNNDNSRRFRFPRLIRNGLFSFGYQDDRVSCSSFVVEY